MSKLGRALVDSLDAEDRAELAGVLAPYLPAPAASGNGWISTREAAEHLGISIGALHRLTAERAIPFRQERPGAKCYFQRSELDTWRGAAPERGAATHPAERRPGLS